MRLYIYVTGERITPESSEFGDAEERGYVDWFASPTTFHDARNYVRPLFEAPYPLTQDDANEAHRLISEVVGDCPEGDTGTYYARDAVVWDYATGDHYTYAVHAFVKRYDGARGWVEDDHELF